MPDQVHRRLVGISQKNSNTLTEASTIRLEAWFDSINRPEAPQFAFSIKNSVKLTYPALWLRGEISNNHYVVNTILKYCVVRCILVAYMQCIRLW